MGEDPGPQVEPVRAVLPVWGRPRDRRVRGGGEAWAGFRRVPRDLNGHECLAGSQKLRLPGPEVENLVREDQVGRAPRAQGVYKPRTREEKKPDKKPAVTQVAAPGRGTVIFVENLPPDLTDSEPFKLLFEQYPGFTDVRLIAQRRVAFVEFTEQRQAEDAINGLQGFMFAPGYQLKLSYAK